ncbi:MAG TPA: acyl-CoA dehydrogenase family protein [Rhodocyclaceae bacterium]|nr:acyl-CoA dehydrogenase family protein [Rhodocyclaceae bacterium]
MDFTFSEDQRAIADLATSVFGDYCADEQLQKQWDSGAAFDAALWLQLRETGLTALVLDEDTGGSALGMVELMLVLEQQGRFLAPAPLYAHQLTVAALARFGADKARLPALAAGEQVATLSLDGIHSPLGIALSASTDGTAWHLKGKAIAVPLAEQSAIALLPAATSGGVKLFVVDMAAAGIRKVSGNLTHQIPAADLYFDHVTVGAPLADDALSWLEPRVIASIAALQLGVSAEALKRVVAYTSERVQFDRPIATFQAITQRTADCLIDVEALRSALWQLCWRIDAGLDATGDMAVTKIWASECGHRVTHAAQHMHGGMGADLTYPIHRFTYWSRGLEATFGGTEAHLNALGQWLANPQHLGVEL